MVFPFLRTSRFVRSLNAAVLRLCIRSLQSRLSLTDPIVFVFNASFNGVIGSLGEKSTVYYSIDDQRSFPGVDPAWFDREEGWLLSQSDCVIACSEELYRRLRRGNDNTHYVPHGVDWGLFRSAVTEELALPEDMRSIPEPRLGFYGFLTRDWFDFPLIGRMAAEHPDWHIVLIGKLADPADLEEVLQRPNVHYLGPKPFEQLPAYTRHFAVGLIPFLVNPITVHCNPLKLLEYLSGGLPVVTTNIPETRKFGPDVRVATSHEEFVAHCRAALQEAAPSARDARSRRARVHSWDNRVRQISRIVLGEEGRQHRQASPPASAPPPEAGARVWHGRPAETKRARDPEALQRVPEAR